MLNRLLFIVWCLAVIGTAALTAFSFALCRPILLVIAFMAALLLMVAWDIGVEHCDFEACSLWLSEEEESDEDGDL